MYLPPMNIFSVSYAYLKKCEHFHAELFQTYMRSERSSTFRFCATTVKEAKEWSGSNAQSISDGAQKEVLRLNC